MCRQHPENARGVPARIAKLKTVSPLAREHLQETAESLLVNSEVRWKLKKDRSDLASQQRKPVFNEFEAVGRAFRQSFPMRDKLRRLPREHEVFPGLRTPAFARFPCGGPVEDAVQFRGGKLTGVELKLRFERQAIREKRSLPRIVMPA